MSSFVRAVLGSRWFLGGAGFLLVPSVLHAADIALGDYKILPDASGQTINVYVSGGDVVQGVDIEAFVADGGPDANGTIRAEDQFH